MDTQTIKAIIAKRVETNDELQAEVEQCWEELSSAIASDYEAAAKFLLEDCTADEASWVSEVYEEIIEKTQSEKFLDLLKQSAVRFPAENELHRMASNLEIAINSTYHKH